MRKRKRCCGSVPPGSYYSSARDIMDELNPNALDGIDDDGAEVFIEDVSDEDGRMYRIEYRTSDGGQTAKAFCRYNPWGDNPFSFEKSHLSEDGTLCLTEDNGPDLRTAVLRARLWVNGYSFLREHGYRETCRVLSDWG